ncbi:site-2 protease family protein [Janthinobacterium fluminis]|uniref:Site-2 protease family protein n=1 Tax=Janthinobacterium fluminis TaxID=2987524 RepID=A0ABT5K3D9_9BURK|nr:site-2 protease family protein [Janthinobacterium fluminis]MDC8759195.1 site-2 protease family protein [Janthinobacterium fluminis]
MNDTSQIIQTIAVYLIPVLFAISLHEAGHGYVARYFGDPTASNEGRLSLNPARHIDPFGTILLPLLLYWSVGIPFGYAKPVPVDYSRLRNPRKQMAWVALAGPGANFAMGLGWMVMLVLLAALNAPDLFFFSEMARAGVSVNAAMCVFNLIPIPPLDGGRIVTGILPLGLARKFARIERYGVYVFVLLVVLMYYRVLDGVLLAAIHILIGIFKACVFPLTLFLN